jgi:hypothetical protein
LGIAKRIANGFRSASSAGETVRWHDFDTFKIFKVRLVTVNELFCACRMCEKGDTWRLC